HAACASLSRCEPMLTLTETSPEAEIFDAAATAAELARLSEVHSGDERELRLGAAPPPPPAPPGGRPAAAAPPLGCPRTAERRAALRHAGRDRARALRVRDQAPLPGAEPFRSRAHGGRRHRRLWPRRARARLRHRSPVPAALQADRLGRIRRRNDPVLPVGHGA